MDFDVAVVGAGPAGSVCARDLARAGLSVVLLDKEAPPRYKTCGGGIVGRALESLQIDVGACIERTLSRVEVRLGGTGAVYAVERSPAPIAMTMRSNFDALLVGAAQDAGAVLQAPSVYRNLRRAGAGIGVQTNRGEVTVGWVVGADGAGSRVASAAGWRRPLRTIPAIESEIHVSEDVFSRFVGAARFDFAIPPHGYGWVFPKAEHLSVGCLTTRRHAGRGVSEATALKQHFEEYLRSLGLDHALEREDHGFAIPTRARSSGPGRDGVLLVGDAAGLADPLTCEGISNAIRSGRLAARAISETRHTRQRTPERYEKLLGASLLPELRWARRLAPLLYGFPRARGFVFRRAGSELCEAFADIFSGRRTYRELLGGPGSYRRFLSTLVRPVAGVEAR